MTSTKLHHRFHLTKPNSNTPLLEVQMTVLYNPNTDQVTPVGILIYCFFSRSFLRGNDSEFFNGIISQEIACTDWKALYASQHLKNINAMIRLHDNVQHGIGSAHVQAVHQIS